RAAHPGAARSPKAAGPPTPPGRDGWPGPARDVRSPGATGSCGTGLAPGRPATASAVGPCKRPLIERRGRPSTKQFVQPRASSCLLAGRTTFPVAALQPTNGVADSGQVVHPLSFESFRQALSGPAQSHVNGSRVDVQEFGNLAGIILQSVTQCQDLPV